jgi:hypothetical protein
VLDAPLARRLPHVAGQSLSSASGAMASASDKTWTVDELVCRLWDMARKRPLPSSSASEQLPPNSSLDAAPEAWAAYARGKQTVLNHAFGFVVFTQLHMKRRVTYCGHDVTAVSSVGANYRGADGCIKERTWVKLALTPSSTATKAISKGKLKHGKHGKKAAKANRREQRQLKMEELKQRVMTHVYVDVANPSLSDYPEAAASAVGPPGARVPAFFFTDAQLQCPTAHDEARLRRNYAKASALAQRVAEVGATRMGVAGQVLVVLPEHDETVDGEEDDDDNEDDAALTVAVTSASASGENGDDHKDSLQPLSTAATGAVTRVKCCAPGHVLLSDADILSMADRIYQLSQLVDNGPTAPVTMASPRQRRAFKVMLSFIYDMGFAVDSETSATLVAAEHSQEAEVIRMTLTIQPQNKAVDSPPLL